MPDLLIDPLGGLCGDMFLAGLVGLGADPEAIGRAVSALPLGEQVRLRVEDRVERAVRGVLLDVEILDRGEWKRACGLHRHEHRSWKDIRAMLVAAGLPGRARERALAVFRCLAEAEGAVHGRPAEDVRFHEVGAVDSIADIVGGALALEQLGVERLHSSAVGLGLGSVECSHGLLPLPAPATLELLRGRPVTQPGEAHELCTPTGAAILAALASFDPPAGTYLVERIAWGLSHKPTRRAPPGVRLSLARPSGDGDGLALERVVLLSCDLDDMAPEYLALAAERLRELPVLDVSLAPLLMKKGRPACELRVLVAPGQADAVARAVLEQTSTFGLRRQELARHVLPRRTEAVQTPWGPVRVKVGPLPGGGERRHVELEDVARLCREAGASWAEVLAAAGGRGANP